jgi:hypothetical protein
VISSDPRSALRDTRESAGGGQHRIPGRRKQEEGAVEVIMDPSAGSHTSRKEEKGREAWVEGRLVDMNESRRTISQNPRNTGHLIREGAEWGLGTVKPSQESGTVHRTCN